MTIKHTHPQYTAPKERQQKLQETHQSCLTALLRLRERDQAMKAGHRRQV